MRMTWTPIIMVGLLIACAAADTPTTKVDEPSAASQPSAKAPTNFPEQASYALGLDIGKSLQQIEFKLDLASLTRGINDTLQGNEPELSPQQAAAAKQKLFAQLEAKQTQKMQTLGNKNQDEGQVFLAANKEKEGIVTTDSGLQYLVLKEGDGQIPTPEDRVTVHYRGTLLDGTEFDSSYKRDKPTTFPVRGVIKGWTEALQLMKVGSTYRLFIPSNLAYGSRGAGQKITPHATLIFDVELLAIEP